MKDDLHSLTPVKLIREGRKIPADSNVQDQDCPKDTQNYKEYLEREVSEIGILSRNPLLATLAG